MGFTNPLANPDFVSVETYAPGHNAYNFVDRTPVQDDKAKVPMGINAVGRTFLDAMSEERDVKKSMCVETICSSSSG